MIRPLSALLLLALLVCAAAPAAERVSPREQAASDLRDLQSSLTTDRQRALLSLSLITDPGVASELGIADKVKAIVLDSSEPNVLIRCWALQTLVTLQKNNIAIPGLMEMLNDLLLPANAASARNPKGYPFQLRLEALRLLANVSNQSPTGKGPDLMVDKIFLILKNLLASRKDLPDSMVAGVYRCVGAFSARQEARDMLMSGLSENAPEVLESVLGSLRNAIMNNATTDRRLAEMLSDRFMKTTDPKDRGLRILILDCLEGIVSNIVRGGGTLGQNNTYKPTNALLEAVQNMLKTGGDEEVVSAVHFLMRISAQDPKIAQMLLEVATPNPARPLNFLTLAKVNQALIDVLIGMGRQKPDATVTASATKIIGHIIGLLDPSETNTVPVELRRSLILGLAGVPVAFDRAPTVEALIKLLEVEAKREKLDVDMVGGIESAISFLTGVTPYKNTIFKEKAGSAEGKGGEKGLERIDLPDYARWIKWFAENQKKLGPGKTPFE